MKLIFIEMIRSIFFAVMLLIAGSVKAQAPLSFGTQPAFRHFNQPSDTNDLKKKWFLTKYVGLSTGFVGFRGHSGTFLSAPLGVQVNRRLTDNVYAFAGVSVAPSYFHSNNAFYQPGFNKNNRFLNANNFGTYSSAQLGLMYINDERTFSISGSIGVGRYDGYSPFYAPGNSIRPGTYKQY